MNVSDLLGSDELPCANHPRHRAAAMLAIVDDDGAVCTEWPTPVPLCVTCSTEVNRLIATERIAEVASIEVRRSDR